MCMCVVSDRWSPFLWGNLCWQRNSKNSDGGNLIFQNIPIYSCFYRLSSSVTAMLLPCIDMSVVSSSSVFVIQFFFQRDWECYRSQGCFYLLLMLSGLFESGNENISIPDQLCVGPQRTLMSMITHTLTPLFAKENTEIQGQTNRGHMTETSSCVSFCNPSCWTRWMALTHCTESRWSWPPTDLTLWTPLCCGPAGWTVKFVSSPLCFFFFCDQTKQKNSSFLFYRHWTAQWTGAFGYPQDPLQSHHQAWRNRLVRSDRSYILLCCFCVPVITNVTHTFLAWMPFCDGSTKQSSTCLNVVNLFTWSFMQHWEYRLGYFQILKLL